MHPENGGHTKTKQNITRKKTLFSFCLEIPPQWTSTVSRFVFHADLLGRVVLVYVFPLSTAKNNLTRIPLFRANTWGTVGGGSIVRIGL